MLIQGMRTLGPHHYNSQMAVKALVVDEIGTQHLIIGLNRENIESLLTAMFSLCPVAILTG